MALTTRAAEVLSDITVYMKYARHIPELNRRETWDEIVDRNKMMHVKKFPQLKKDIFEAYDLIYKRQVLPSMRGLQFGGRPIELSPNRQFNCAYLPVDHPKAFSEIMFLLLGGTGVGYSVQRHHVAKLPEIKRLQKKRKRFLVGDSIEGWADAVRACIRPYFYGGPQITFDFSDIREKGSPLVTSGGKAPGPQPLKDCVHNIRKVLDSKSPGDRLTSLEVHDIVCYVADAVLAGGIRRAALIALFSLADEDMLTCKSGRWWELNPQRGRANNSAVVLRHRVKKEDFDQLWKRIRQSGAGEPGIYFSNDREWGCNPCVEIALRPFQFCNLTTFDVSDVTSQEELERRAKAAAFVGTLQAAYTDFHYLRDEWRSQTERDALIGVSMTGIASGAVQDLDLAAAAEVVKQENERVASAVGIRAAARLTCVKPEGTSSLVLGTSSGIHSWHDSHYLRRLTVGKDEPIYSYLVSEAPELIEDDFEKPHLQAKITIPVQAPEGSVTREESALNMLERVRDVSQRWVAPGHKSGDNTHNVSATVSVRDGEWDEVGEWMWQNRECFNGLSVLPFDGGTYTQAPHESCSEDEFKIRLQKMNGLDLSKVVETEDLTALKESIACGGGACELN